MSNPATAFQGTYSTASFDAAKRYKLQYQKGRALADSELLEAVQASDSFIRQIVANNFSNGSSSNNGFKIVESVSDPVNNFTIKGGDGTVNGAGVLFVDGYCLFLKSDIEYKNQDATGLLTDDDYTKTVVGSMPSGIVTIKVYVDFYFAEVSANAGSEYLDSTLLVSGIGSATANRTRQVQDILVTTGAIPVNGFDGNGIYHRYAQIGHIIKTLNNSTLNAANGCTFVDDRILINSLKSMVDGSTVNQTLVGITTIGSVSQPVSDIYMASNVNYASDLLFKSSGEKIRITTAGRIGVGSTTPTNALDIFGTGNIGQSIKALGGNAFITIDGQASNASSSILYFKSANTDKFLIRNDNLTNTLFLSDNLSTPTSMISLASGTARIGVGTATPQSAIHLNAGTGTTLITGNLSVTGSTIITNTEITTTDKLEIDQAAAQQALIVNKTNVAGGTVVEVTNAGTGAAMTILGTGSKNVGIGTSPNTLLDLYGGVLKVGNLTNPTISLRDYTATLSYNIVNVGGRFSLQDNADVERVTVTQAGNVGISSSSPTTKLDVLGSALVTGNFNVNAPTASWGNTLGIGTAQASGKLNYVGISTVQANIPAFISGIQNDFGNMLGSALFVNGKPTEANVGVGTEGLYSILNPFSIEMGRNNSSAINHIGFGGTFGNTQGSIYYNNSTNLMEFKTNQLTKMSIDVNGNSIVTGSLNVKSTTVKNLIGIQTYQIPVSSLINFVGVGTSMTDAQSTLGFIDSNIALGGSGLLVSDPSSASFIGIGTGGSYTVLQRSKLSFVDASGSSYCSFIFSNNTSNIKSYTGSLNIGSFAKNLLGVQTYQIPTSSIINLVGIGSSMADVQSLATAIDTSYAVTGTGLFISDPASAAGIGIGTTGEYSYYQRSRVLFQNSSNFAQVQATSSMLNLQYGSSAVQVGVNTTVVTSGVGGFTVKTTANNLLGVQTYQIPASSIINLVGIGSNMTDVQNLVSTIDTSYAVTGTGLFISDPASAAGIGIGTTGEYSYHQRSRVLFQNSSNFAQVQATSSILNLQYGSASIQVGVNTTTISNYTKIGSSAPALQSKKLTGTSAAAVNGTTNIAHGLTYGKILSVEVFIQGTNGGNDPIIPPFNSIDTTMSYQYWIESTNIVVKNGSALDAAFRSKPITILVWYEA